MKNLKTIIIILILVIFVGLCIYLARDFFNRHDFLTQMQLVDYDEYILTFSINNKKTAIYYSTHDFVAMREYNDSGELNNHIIIYNYDQCLKYDYDIDTEETSISPLPTTRDTHVNNQDVLNLLKNGNIFNKQKFEYKETETINNRECHVLAFKGKHDTSTTVYVDKEFLYTVKIDHYVPSLKNDIENVTNNKHITWEYTMDFELKQKDLFDKIDMENYT